MKLNWINVFATLLIVAGIFLLFHRNRVPLQNQSVRLPRSPTTNPITNEEIKTRSIQRIEATMRRPLNDVEKQMITVDREGDVAKVTMVEPLKGRYLAAERQLAIQKARLAESTMPVPALNASPASGGSIPPMTPLPMPSTVPGN